MTLPAQSRDKDEVSPLELFFDLVFVFAVSQLSHHLLEHLSWRGAETLVMLIAVFGVWSYTSFEATVLHVGRTQTQWIMLAVMLVGLFMNAAIAHAFDTGGWAFVVPLLLIQAGRPILTIVTAPTPMLRQHYAIMLGWIVAAAPLWIAGAMVEAESRLLWWAGAAVVDLVGTCWPTRYPDECSARRTSAPPTSNSPPTISARSRTPPRRSPSREPATPNISSA